MAAPNPGETPDSYRRKRRRRRRRTGKEANGAGCSCGRPSSRPGPGPGPSLRTSFPGKFGAGGRSGEPSSGSSCSSLESRGSLRPRGWGHSWAPILGGRHALSPPALLLSPPPGSKGVNGNLCASLSRPQPTSGPGGSGGPTHPVHPDMDLPGLIQTPSPVFRAKPGPDTQVHSNLEMSIAGGAKQQGRRSSRISGVSSRGGGRSVGREGWAILTGKPSWGIFTRWS